MTQVLRGNIVHAPKMGELSILEHGYMVLEDGVIRGVYPTLPEELAQALERLGRELFAAVHKVVQLRIRPVDAREQGVRVARHVLDGDRVRVPLAAAKSTAT